MTGNVLIDLAISAAGVALLVGLSRLVFGGVRAQVDEAAAAERLAFDEPDFEPEVWFLDSGGRGAAAVNAQGEIAVVKPLGDGLATRRGAASAFRLSCDGATLEISAPDHTFPRLSLAAPSDEAALQWAVRLFGKDAI